ncbi:MAG: hypothetical protein AAF771_05945 [Pseudomonadota bacterium]
MATEFDDASTATRIFAHAERHAARLGYRFGDGSDQDVRQLADMAVAEVRIADRAGLEFSPMGAEVRMRQAEAALEVLVEQMVIAANEIPGYADSHPGVIGEQSLREALRKICPIWPICK